MKLADRLYMVMFTLWMPIAVVIAVCMALVKFLKELTMQHISRLDTKWLVRHSGDALIAAAAIISATTTTVYLVGNKGSLIVDLNDWMTFFIIVIPWLFAMVFTERALPTPDAMYVFHMIFIGLLVSTGIAVGIHRPPVLTVIGMLIGMLFLFGVLAWVVHVLSTVFEGDDEKTIRWLFDKHKDLVPEVTTRFLVYATDEGCLLEDKTTVREWTCLSKSAAYRRAFKIIYSERYPDEYKAWQERYKRKLQTVIIVSSLIFVTVLAALFQLWLMG